MWPHTWPELRDSIRAAVVAGLEALKVPEPMSLSQWAAQHFYLSAESSQKEGQWIAYPYQVGLMDCMSNDDITEFDWQKSARTGYTKCLLAMVAYTAQRRRRNQCVWQPTDADSDDFCKTELEPMLRDVAAMRKVFPKALARSKVNTLQQKRFLGSSLKLRGAKASGNFRRMTITLGIVDEFDAVDRQIEKSSDPWTLVHKRLEGATFPKEIYGTTPRIKGKSNIEDRMAVANIRIRYHIECPHCGLEHPLTWGGKDKKHGFKWDAHDPEGTARHHCPHCHAAITQQDYLRIWHRGVWVSECGNYRLVQDLSDPLKPRTWWTDAAGMPCLPPKHVGAYIWTLYSPQVTWGALVTEYLDARRKQKAGDSAAMQGYVNETRGETWAETVEENDAHELQKRAEPYALRTVPAGGLVLVAGVDQQDDRFEVVVWAFGEGEESWVIDYRVITAQVSDEQEWDKLLWPYLNTTFRHARGRELGIDAIAIDTGGHYTHQAYNFVRRHAHEKKLYAVKGESKEEQPVKTKSASLQDVNDRGRIIRRGVRLWMVGTDTAKDLIHGRLNLKMAPDAKPKGAGHMHFSAGLPIDFYDQLTAEVRAQVKTSAGPKSRWVKRSMSARNEVLDCTVYAVFCAHALNLHVKTQAEWALLRQAVEPGLFDVVNEEPPMPAGAIQVRDITPTQPPQEEPPSLPSPDTVRPVRTFIPPTSPFGGSIASSQWSSRL